MVTFKMTDGTVRRTARHTLDQARSAHAANVGIIIGGADEPFDPAPPVETLYPERIASIGEDR